MTEPFNLKKKSIVRWRHFTPTFQWIECMVLKSHASKANIARHHMSLEIKRRVALQKSILFKEFEFPAFLCITKPLKIEKNHNKTVKNDLNFVNLIDKLASNNGLYILGHNCSLLLGLCLCWRPLCLEVRPRSWSSWNNQKTVLVSFFHFMYLPTSCVCIWWS